MSLFPSVVFIDPEDGLRIYKIMFWFSSNLRFRPTKVWVLLCYCQKAKKSWDVYWRCLKPKPLWWLQSSGWHVLHKKADPNTWRFCFSDRLWVFCGHFRLAWKRSFIVVSAHGCEAIKLTQWVKHTRGFFRGFGRTSDPTTLELWG